MPNFSLDNKQQDSEDIRMLYGINKNDIVALFLGRMTVEKGIKDMFLSLDKIDLPSNFVLLMVGDGDFYDEAKRISATKKYRVVYTGSQSNIQRFYNAADFFIMPSLHENHSISLL
jgi:glycosyltransferase involved in cell wall biosynthesis